MLFPGQRWEQQRLAPPHPPSLRRPEAWRGVRAAVTNGSAKQGLTPLLVQPARWGGGGMVCSTLVPLFSRTTCSVCTAACGTPGGNQTSESSRNSQALLGSGGARAGMEQWSWWPVDSLPESQKEGDSRSVLFGIKWTAGFWQELHTRGLSVPSDPV